MYYVIQVKTGKEDKAIEDIKQYKKDQDYDFEIFSPYRESLRKYNGKYKTVKERCFPGYVFVETNDIEQLFKDLYWVEGYTRILGREGTTYKFVPLDKNESRMIDILYNENTDRTTEISDIEVIEGDKIRIISGPLMGIQSTIKKVDLHKRVVTVEFGLCNRTVEAKVGINIISKINY